MTKPTAVLVPLLCILVGMFSMQWGATVAKGIFPVAGPVGASTLRLIVATLVLSLVWRPWRVRGTGGVIPVIIYGVSLAGMNTLFYFALERIPLGMAVAIEFSGPLAVAICTSRRPTDFFWAVLAVAGIALILPFNRLPGSLDPVGVLYAVGGAFFWALYILYGRRSGGSMEGGVATTLGMGVATLAILPFGIASAGNSLWNPSLLPFALGVGIFSSALPFSLEMVALKRLPTSTFSIFMSLEPVVAALSGRVHLGESLSGRQWGAIACLILASVGTSLSVKPPVPLPVPAPAAEPVLEP